MNDEITRIEQKLAEAWAARELAQMRADCADNAIMKAAWLAEVERLDLLRMSLYAKLDAMKGCNDG